MNFSDKAADERIDELIEIERFKAEAVAAVASFYAELEGKTVGAISRRNPNGVKRQFRDGRTKALIEDVSTHITVSYGALTEDLKSKLLGLAELETKEAIDSLNSIAGVRLLDQILNTPELNTLIDGTLFEGSVNSEWWETQEAGLKTKFSREMRKGVALGETNDQLIRRVKVQFPRSVYGAGLANAESLVRTAVQTISNEARLRTFAKNESVIKGIQWISTLDDKTCFRAGTKVRMADNSLKNIEQIKEGEFVLSGMGIPREIVGTLKKRSSDWRIIRLKDGTELKCTKNHPLWTEEGWKEAQDIKEGERLGNYYCELPVLRHRVRDEKMLDSERGREALFPKVLWACSDQEAEPEEGFERPGCLGQESLPELRKVVRDKKDLRSKIEEFCELLQHRLSERISKRRIDCRGSYFRLRKVRQKLQAPASIFQEWKKRSFLFDEMPSSKGEDKMRALWEFIREEYFWISKCPLLFKALLLQKHSSLKLRSANGADFNQEGLALQETGANREADEFGFLSTGMQNRNRGRSQILAFEETKSGFKETKTCTGERLEADRDSDRYRKTISSDFESVPRPNGWIEVESIEVLESEDYCYDVEVDKDHCFLVGESGIIAHNSDICISLANLLWERQDSGVYVPIGHTHAFPGSVAHFRCRSTQIGVTKSWDELSRKGSIRRRNGSKTSIEGLFRRQLVKQGKSPLEVNTIIRNARASIDGQVARETTFDEFWNRRSKAAQNAKFGPAKAQLFRDGKISMKDLTDQSNRPRTLKELTDLVKKRRI